MAWSLYSERLLIGAGGAVTTWVVPAGHRAVVRSIVVVWHAVTSCGVYVGGSCGDIYARSNQAQFLTDVQDVRIPLYAGESLRLEITQVGGHATIGGYLFEDLTGRSSAPGEITRAPSRGPAPLPT
jgi:hypothetical protein